MAPLAPVDGIGWHIQCRGSINEFLAAMSEYDKWGSSAATTIMALIPLLISVWGLPTADIRELYLIDEHLVAGVVAGLTFGLPTPQASSFKQLTEEDLQSQGLDLSAPKSNCHDRHGRLYRLLFFATHIAISLSAICFTNFVTDSPPQAFWSCPSGPVIWHVIFIGIIPLVGLSWWFALHITYQKIPGRRAISGVILYNRKFVLHPAIRLVPGLLHALFTILYTFMFAVLYGTSIRSALERVLFVTFLVFMCRTLSLWYASTLKAWHPKLLIHCEDGGNLEDKHNLVEHHVSVSAPPSTPPLLSPPVSFAELGVQTLDVGREEEWIPFTDMCESNHDAIRL